MQDTVKISGQVDFGTQYRATRSVVAHSRAILFSYAFFVGLPLLLLVLMIIAGPALGGPSLHNPPVLVALLLGPAFVFLFLPLCHALNVWQLRRRNASVRGTLTFIISREGFESHGDSFDVRLRWDAINRVIETKEFFLFYVSTAMAHFIPKAYIVSREELQTIRAIIHETVGDKAKLQTE